MRKYFIMKMSISYDATHIILYRVAQTRMAHDKVADDLHEMSKPLARYKDDEDLENMLRAREREDDPMLQYIKSKKAKKNVTIDSQGRKRPKKGVITLCIQTFIKIHHFNFTYHLFTNMTYNNYWAKYILISLSNTVCVTSFFE